MLLTTDIVKVSDPKDPKKRSKYVGTFERPYLSQGPDDAVEKETVKVETVDNGELAFDVTSPKEKVSVYSKPDAEGKTRIAELVAQAVEYYRSAQEKDEKDPAKRVDPWVLLLSDTDDGLVSRLRMKKRNEMIPAEINEDKARNNAAALLVKNGKFPTIEAAMEALVALGM